MQSNQDVSSQIQLQSNQDTQLQSNQNISTQSQQSQNIYSDNDDNLQTYPVASQSQYSVEDIQNQIDECKEEKEKALEKLEIDQNVSVAQQIKNIEETIKNLENNLSEAENNWNNLSEDNIEISQSKVKYSEISTMYSELNTYQSKKTEIESNIKSLYSNIDNSTITANQSGVVNIKKEYVVGDYIEAGVEVLNIVPQDSSKYIVEIYIANSDIGKLREDMDVKYELTAFPSSEYGNVTGEILAISKDIKANADNNAYYIAKASIDTTTFYDRNGEENTLKVGMACQAKLVIDRRRILFYILEKLNLLKNSL